MTSKRFLLITGCGRSGTNYVAKCFATVFGPHLMPHESVGMLGSVSWYFAPTHARAEIPQSKNKDDKKHHSDGSLPQNYDFSTQVHQIRHPLKCIGSACTSIRQRDFDYAEAHYPHAITKDKLRRAMAYWLHWNLLVEDRKPEFTYRIEDFNESTWRALLAAARLPPVQLPPVSKQTNSGSGLWKARVVTWDDLRQADHELCAEILELAARYGYT